MCGIVGVFHFDPTRPVDRALLVRQTDTLVHRGPDDGGVWVGQGVGLGHRRLAIIDLDGGHQPMWDVEDRIGVVFNGEIYNYRELQRELEQKGHVFRTGSDTEVIIHGYREWGDRCVERFRGMFAFAVFDRKNRTLFLARDRLGKKPLYWYRDRERFVFASELKAIVADLSIPRVLDPQAALDYFAYNYVPGPRSIFRNIHKLPGGHALLVTADGVAEREWWDVDFSRPDTTLDLDSAASALTEALARAVGLRLRADVPLGAFLSGGVDSSFVVALMAGQLDRRVKTHTVGFGEGAFDERPFAREIAERFHTEHTERVVDVEDTGVVDRLAWYFDEPFGDSSAVPTYHLSASTRAHVTVALSGDGGDESFAGYRRYVFAMREHGVRRHLPGLVRSAVVAPLASIYPKADYLPRYLRARATLTNVATTHERAYFLSLTQKTYPRYLDDGFLAGLAGYDPYGHFERHFARARTDDPLARLQYVDLKTYLADDILVKVDRASMAHALEVRVPLLDHEVVELAARMPSSLKLDGAETKRVLKHAAARLLPERTRTRPKMGFTIPLAAWLRGGLRGRAEAAFFDRPGGASGLVDVRGLRRLWYEHQLGVADHSTALWSLLMFEEWARRFASPYAALPERPPRRARPSVIEGLAEGPAVR
ncbi:asparagine synthase (glutamine-hydrolyzing) [Myxococcota bacterium]|nr:asparagine synthase (glutamine-hydrolyzing) [Myxococcota bacterium]